MVFLTWSPWFSLKGTLVFPILVVLGLSPTADLSSPSQTTYVQCLQYWPLGHLLFPEATTLSLCFFGFTFP